MKIKLILILFFVSGIVSAQDIVPMPFEREWPLSSSIIDSVEYFTALSIAKNKVKYCTVIDEQGKKEKQIFYDRNGRVTSEVFYYSNSDSSQTDYIRNSQGQILEKHHISYKDIGRIEYLEAKYEYIDNLPSRMYKYYATTSQIEKEAVYENGILTGILNKDLSPQNRFYMQRVYKKNDTAGAYTFLGGNSEPSLFENSKKDSIVVGHFAVTRFKIQNHRIICEKFFDVDYGTETNFYYDENGLVNYSENEFYEVITNKSKSYYSYSYYED